MGGKLKFAPHRVEFESQGAVHRGWLLRPALASPSSPAPAIVVINALGTLNDGLMATQVALPLYDRGYNVLRPGGPTAADAGPGNRPPPTHGYLLNCTKQYPAHRSHGPRRSLGQ